MLALIIVGGYHKKHRSKIDGEKRVGNLVRISNWMVLSARRIAWKFFIKYTEIKTKVGILFVFKNIDLIFCNSFIAKILE